VQNSVCSVHIVRHPQRSSILPDIALDAAVHLRTLPRKLWSLVDNARRPASDDRPLDCHGFGRSGHYGHHFSKNERFEMVGDLSGHFSTR
jgi:hypothetical protein